MSERHGVRAVDVKVTEDELSVVLEDGRTLVVPLAWYPRLSRSSQRQRGRWRLIGRGLGIHWPEIDEDISVEDLLAGRRSGESQASLKRWLEARVSVQRSKRISRRRAGRAAAATERGRMGRGET